MTVKRKLLITKLHRREINNLTYSWCYDVFGGTLRE